MSIQFSKKGGNLFLPGQIGHHLRCLFKRMKEMRLRNEKTTAACFSFLFNHLVDSVGLGNPFRPGLGQRGTVTAYGWNAYGGDTGLAEGPVSIEIPSGELRLIKSVADDTIRFMSGGDFVEEAWY